MKRCAWVNMNNPLYVEYHDKEWGRPVHDDTKLFEMLILEGAQAGLSWETVLNKRENYRKAFDYWDIDMILKYDEEKITELLQNEGIIRNKLKVHSVVKNARVFREIQNEFGSFDSYIWSYVDHTPIQNRFEKLSDIPASTKISDTISKDLKKRGMSFVGSTIMYAYMQAIGMVNDHEVSCDFYEGN
ncbi:DNA-3-methyladenine glycosylase I [Candidatus Gracilibacteria bacterium]|nr:DNA-3-methyladenine glycosylase I [Candidatus Gracilibacteria bacterium]